MPNSILVREPESENIRALARAVQTLQQGSGAYVPPTVAVDRSQDGTYGYVTLTITDPQGRLTKVEFNTQQGAAGAWSGYAQDALTPYQTSVPLVAGDTSTIKYRITALDATGAASVLKEDAVAFVQAPAGGPTTLPGQCLVRMVSATATTITFQVDGFDSQGTPINVQLVAVRGSATLAAGQVAIGVSKASGWQWTFNRGAALGPSGQVEFKATGATALDDSDLAEVPEQGRDTVLLSCRAAVIASDAAHVTVRVTVDDPFPQGGSYITITPTAANCTVSPTSPPAIASGGYVDFTIDRPQFAGGTGRVLFTASAANRVVDYDAVDVPSLEKDTRWATCRIKILSVTATQVTVEVRGFDPDGSETGMTVELVEITGQATAASGAAAGSFVASGSQWVLNRPAFAAGVGQARFRATGANLVNDDDTIDLPEQGRDTVSLQLKCQVIVGAPAGKLRVRTTAIDPLGGGGLTTTVENGQGTGGVNQVAGASANAASGTTADWDITRPTAGQPPGRVLFKLTGAGRTDDYDSVDVPSAGADTVYDQCTVQVVSSTATQMQVQATSKQGGTVTLQEPKPTVIVARKASADGRNLTGAGEILKALGYNVTYNFTADLATCRGYEVVVIDCAGWSVGEHSAFITSLLDDGQHVLCTGNDTSTDFYPILATAAAPASYTESKAGAAAHPVQDGWAGANLPALTDGARWITSLQSWAVPTLVYAEDSTKVAAFYFTTLRGGLCYFDANLGNYSLTGDVGRYAKNVVGYLSRIKRLSGPVPGVASGNNSSWVFQRMPIGGGNGTPIFQADTAGYVSDQAAVIIPEQGRDTVALKLQAVVLSTDATQLVVRVTATDPVGQSGSYITIDKSSALAVTPAGAQLVANGGYIDFTIPRPAFQAGTGRVLFTASAANRVDGIDAVDVPEQGRDTQYVTTAATLVAADATTVTIRGDVSVPAGAPAPTVKFNDSRGVNLVSGPALYSQQPTGTQWVFSRPAFQAGAGMVTLRGEAAGLVSDDDVIVIPEQGRDTVFLDVRTEILTVSFTQVEVNIIVTDGVPQGGSYITLAAVKLGVANLEYWNGSAYVAWGSGPGALASGATLKARITRSPYGTGVGRVTFKATAANRVGDSDSVDIPSQDATNQLSIRVEQLGTSTATQLVLRVRAADPVPQGLNSIAINYTTDGLGTVSPASGQVTGTPTASLDTTGYVDFTVPIPAAGSRPGSITFTAVAAGRAASATTVPVPPQGSSGSTPAGFSGYYVTKNDSTDQLTVNWTYSGAKDHYLVKWREQGASTWQSATSFASGYQITVNPPYDLVSSGTSVTQTWEFQIEAYDSAGNFLNGTPIFYFTSRALF